MKKNVISVFFVLGFCFSVFAQSSEILDELSAKQNLQAEEFSANVQTAMSNPNYIVTAGDVYSLNYSAGGTPVSYTIPVDSTYKIRVANLAVLDVKGKTYLSVKKEIENIVIRNYPMSGVQFVLLNPASFTVVVKGEVTSTFEKRAWALTRLSDVLKTGLTGRASTRNIVITDKDGKSKTVDLFKARREGDLSQNPYVRPGDVITVGRLERKVEIRGEVERPGTYELLSGENLKDLVERYGNGLTEFADLSRIEILKAKTENSVVGEKFYIKASGLDDPQIAAYKVDCYDTIYIDSFNNLKPSIFVEGAVIEGAGKTGTELVASNKLSLVFNPGENYAFFVRNHRGIFTSVSDLENAYITRNGEYIPVDLNLMLYDASYYSDLVLEKDDILTVPFKQFFVSVAGAVNKPGRYPFIPDRGFDYYVGLAGGFDTNKNSMEMVEIIDVNGKKHKKNEKILPEYTITAKTNSFLYYFNHYAPVITTLLSIVSTTITVFAVVGK